jgi:hypothetical protein
VPSRTFGLILGVLHFANLLVRGAVVAIHRFSPKVMEGNERRRPLVPRAVVRFIDLSGTASEPSAFAAAFVNCGGNISSRNSSGRRDSASPISLAAVRDDPVPACPTNVPDFGRGISLPTQNVYFPRFNSP